MKNVFLIFAFWIFVFYGCSSNSGTDNKQDSQEETVSTEASSEVNIDKESAKDSYCIINKLFEDNNKYYLTVDYIKFLRGDEAEAEAKKQGVEVCNDYMVVNDNTKLRTFFDIRQCRYIFD